MKCWLVAHQKIEFDATILQRASDVEKGRKKNKRMVVK